MRCSSDQQLLIETPDDYHHPSVQLYIQGEVNRPSKQWIGNVLDGTQESEHIKLETDEFLLLPDTERVNRYWGVNTGKKVSPKINNNNNSNENTVMINWLAIVKDKGIRTLRDLRGEHIPMLERLRDQCISKVQEECGVNSDEIMVYLHYHPSVYHLHIHVAYPYMQHNHRDVYRIHSLNTVIDNLRLRGDYYEHARLQVSVNKDSVLYKVIKG